MIHWVDENGVFQTHLPASAFAEGIWTETGGIGYRHLLPGKATIATMALPPRPEFDYDKGEVESSVLLFAKEGVLDCALTIKLYLNATLVSKQVVNPTAWESDIVERVSLERVTITREQIIVVYLERDECEGEDTVGVLACSFLATGVQ